MPNHNIRRWNSWKCLHLIKSLINWMIFLFLGIQISLLSALYRCINIGMISVHHIALDRFFNSLWFWEITLFSFLLIALKHQLEHWSTKNHAFSDINSTEKYCSIYFKLQHFVLIMLTQINELGFSSLRTENTHFYF